MAMNENNTEFTPPFGAKGRLKAAALHPLHEAAMRLAVSAFLARRTARAIWWPCCSAMARVPGAMPSRRRRSICTLQRVPVVRPVYLRLR